MAKGSELGGMSLKEIAQCFNFFSDGAVAGRLGDVKKKILNDDVGLLYKQLKNCIYDIKYTCPL